MSNLFGKKISTKKELNSQKLYDQLDQIVSCIQHSQQLQYLQRFKRFRLNVLSTQC